MRVVGSACRGLRSGYPYPTGELSDLGRGAWLSAKTFNAPGCSSARAVAVSPISRACCIVWSMKSLEDGMSSASRTSSQ